MWLLALLLRRVIELICALAIPADQVDDLKVLIDEYIFFQSVAPLWLSQAKTSIF